MLREVIDLQNNAVENLLATTNLKNEIIFKSPTGTGKTYMMADYMNRVLLGNPNVVFLVSSLSKGNLAEQNEEKFKEYILQGQFTSLNPYLISTESSGEEGLHIPTNYNVYILPRDLYKKNGKLMQGSMTNFLNTITSKHLMNGLNKEIYLIKDECHIATNNLDSISNDYFSKIINISATPKLKRGQIPDVFVKEKDAIAARLIKSIVWGEETDTLEDALHKFKEIKEEYLTRIGINPCMIIQISNKDIADKELKEKIYPILNSSDFNDLKWMLIVDKEKDCDTNDRIKTAKLPISKWKNYAKSNNSSIDIIIFKMVITEGWDIPRACMLYQERNTQSKQLDEQVMGRVRRNPCLLNYEKLDKEAKDLVTKAYIWGVKKEEIGVPIKIKEEYKDSLQIMTTRLKREDKKSIVNVKDIIDKEERPISFGSIFDLYDKFNRLTEESRSSCFDNITTFEEWFKYAFYSSKIQEEYKKFICNYKDSMELTKDENGCPILVSFPIVSVFEEKSYNCKMKNWVWCRQDGKDSFSFDSDAEKDFAEELKEFIGKDTDYIWGKNFLPNSEIKFEYYNNGIHASYPDFILKDKKEQIHIFEVKSVNISNSQNIDKDSYEQKIRDLEEAYKQAAVLTGYIFYLPIKNGNVWDIKKIRREDDDVIVEPNLSLDDVLKDIAV